MNLLCIKWSVNNGQGYTSPKQDTPENREFLQRDVAGLKEVWSNGSFQIVDYPFAVGIYSPRAQTSLAPELVRK